MGRAPCCSKVGLHRGPWTPKEDSLLINYIRAHGEGQWRSLPKRAGLLRCGKSCRLRWVNYLKPDIKRGNITPDEDDLIIRLHTLLGNRWSLIAGRLSGRTDNEIKNYWNTHLSKRLKSQGADLSSHGQSPKLNRAARQEKRKSTKKYKNQHDEHKIKCNNNNNNLEREKPKLFLPKPIRITSLSLTRNNSFESNMSNDASSSHDGGSDHHHHHHQHHHESTLLDDITCTYDDDHHHYHHGSTLLDDMPWTWHHDDGVSTFLIGCDDDDDDMMSNDGSTSNNGTKLEKLYEEYLQLLNVDDDHAHVMDGHEHAST